MKKTKGINIKSDKAVTFHTEGTSGEIRKALAKAESLAKAWVESAIDTLGGEIVPEHPISWGDGNGNYITKIHRNDCGEVCVELGHREYLRERPNTQSKYAASKWAYPHVMTTALESTNFSWVRLYESLVGENLTDRV